MLKHKFHLLPMLDTDQLPLAKVEEVTKELCSDWYSLSVELDINHGVRKVNIIYFYLCKSD